MIISRLSLLSVLRLKWRGRRMLHTLQRLSRIIRLWLSRVIVMRRSRVIELWHRRAIGLWLRLLWLCCLWLSELIWLLLRLI